MRTLTIIGFILAISSCGTKTDVPEKASASAPASSAPAPSAPPVDHGERAYPCVDTALTKLEDACGSVDPLIDCMKSNMDWNTCCKEAEILAGNCPSAR